MDIEKQIKVKKIQEYNKKYRRDNLEKIKSKKLNWDNSHKKEISEYEKTRYQKNREYILNSNRNRRKNNKLTKPIRSRYNDIKRGAKKRKVFFDFDYLTLKKYEDDFWGKYCNYCGDLNIKNGIDRVDNSKGYVEGNCVPCCPNCNAAKMSSSIDQYHNRLKKQLIMMNYHQLFLMILQVV